jgi:hypothetical protein
MTNNKSDAEIQAEMAPDATFIKNVLKQSLFKKPERPKVSSALKYGATGAILLPVLSALVKKMKDKEVTASSVAVNALLGGALGAGTYWVSQNIKDQLDGYTTDTQETNSNTAKIETSPDAPPKTYVVYIKGAGRRFREYTEPIRETILNSGDEATVLNYKWAEVDEVVSDINKIRPEDKVIIMGHSAGGGAAVEAASRVSRPIEKLITLDPVQMSLKEKVKEWTGNLKKPDNVKVWENHIPENYDEPGWSNALVKHNPLRMSSNIAGQTNIRYKHENHSLESIRIRPKHIDDNTMDFNGIVEKIIKKQTPTVAHGVWDEHPVGVV